MASLTSSHSSRALGVPETEHLHLASSTLTRTRPEQDSPVGRGTAARKISVMHLIHSMAYGGIETAVINWLRTIDRTKFDVSLVCFANPGNTEAPFVEAANRAGLEVGKIPWSRRKPLIKSSRCLAQHMRSHKVDILHLHNVYADCVGALAARMFKVRTITTVYVLADYGNWKRDLIQKIEEKVIHLFDRVTAHCEDTRDKMIDLGFCPKRIDTLICGFETHPVIMSREERSLRRRAMGIADDEILLGNVARLYPEKAQDSLLRCFKDIVAECPKARLRIAGVGPLDAALRTLCSQMGLDDKVEFVGFLSDLPNFMCLLDIQVHPSHIEGVPLALCEGLAAGLPIVASAVGGVPEILNHGRAGVLVPAEDEAAFSRAVIELINHPEERSRIGTAAKQFIANDYSLKTAVAKVERTYCEMIGTGA
jgi:glycosyltransferase involved in cell wall biosynthesis